ncbi:MAG: metal-dependent transcriptional regulator [Nitrospinae bacterium]|nr:metal-dependent transcriptional regulator [Nitrospinota bacterium]
MDKKQQFEENLEKIGMRFEEGNVTLDGLRNSGMGEVVIDEMKNKGIISIHADGSLRLTNRGQIAFNSLIRRHRLAERLMNDILNMSHKSMERHACKFEHILDTDITESICILLGHPTTCPHGKVIPPGDCCSKGRKELEPLIVSLDNLSSGEAGKILYISTRDHHRLDKLTSFGLMPGTIVKVHQKQPAIVILFDETTLSIDSEVAREIYVRKIKI